MSARSTGYLVLVICLGLQVFCFADSQEPYTIVIKDHLFSPVSLTIPAGQKIRLNVENHDPTVEEFESYDLNREKVVSGNKKIIVFIGPLKQGTYKYFGDFHQKTAQGIIIAQ
jgi:plastocyanin